VIVRHSSGSYEIESVGFDAAFGEMPSDLRIITDENVDRLYGERIPSGMPKLVLPPGEGTKSLEWFGRCLSWLAESGATRKTSVLALGGGVIGDLVGFTASAYMRGVPLLQLPTTLLSQVDSAVGGKVGVDLPEGKNLAGAFHPPKAVFICSETLNTLPERQFRNGMAEVVKYGFILAAELLDDLPGPGEPLGTEVVMKCLDLKRQVVEEDEYESTGSRAVLNYGHTVGHAIEHVTGYGPVLHGEAISIGMVVEADLGEALGVSPLGTRDLVTKHLQRQGLPTTSDVLREGHSLATAMRRDKKSGPRGLGFSLLTRIGECKLFSEVPEEAVLKSLSRT
jgi:3-dehydroquinate synthase